MIDVIRTFWPDRKGLYTCKPWTQKRAHFADNHILGWNTKLQARETNYGGRIDYILVTKGLLPWISHGDIQPSLKGSDHCPIYIDLRDEIVLESGETVKLRDAMQQTDAAREPPRIAAKFWDEFSGKQTVLSAFFSKRAVPKDASNNEQRTPPMLPGSQRTDTPGTSSAVMDEDAQLSTTQPASQPIASTPAPSPKVSKKIKPPQPSKPAPAPATNKRKPPEPTASSSKKRKQVKGQASLASFFSKPAAASTSKSREVIDIEDDTPTASTSALAPDTPPLSQAEQDQLDADYRLACELAQEDAEPSPTPSSSQEPTQKKAAWSELFAPIQPPNCMVHGEPTKMYTVNKPGPNKGKTFFICSRCAVLSDICVDCG